MQSIFSNALSRAVAKHIDLSVTRRETLSWLTTYPDSIAVWPQTAPAAGTAAAPAD